eukprot:TRINITY_DN13818_c0_g1_i1.p1 TRINITY_DN13818_c0_g1~~TRINITY_DN13818_c0_g1_i1.p1  ORF type:complete len:150 (+),score=37.38 TRINITY_DN13818_c0_g1_i1:257-706(+)
MEFGSELVFVGSSETEEIFEDEIVDGIASCAREQAQAWADIAKENSESSGGLPPGIDQKFIDEIKRMATTASRLRSAPLRHDGQTDVYGVFSSTRRVQPRYQDRSKAQQFDHVARERARVEMEARDARKDRLHDMKAKLAGEDSEFGDG